MSCPNLWCTLQVVFLNGCKFSCGWAHSFHSTQNLFFWLENLQMLQAMAGMQDVQMSCSSGTRQFVLFSMQRTLFQNLGRSHLARFPDLADAHVHSSHWDPACMPRMWTLAAICFRNFFVASGECIASSGEWASKSNSGETMEQTCEMSLMHTWGPMLLATHGVFHALC